VQAGIDERQDEAGAGGQRGDETRPLAQRQAAGVRADLEDRDEADDRRDEHQVEDVDAVRVARGQRVGVDDAHLRIGGRDPLQHPRDRCAGGARDVQRRTRRRRGRAA
jgi:hypothetical protein